MLSNGIDSNKCASATVTANIQQMTYILLRICLSLTKKQQPKIQYQHVIGITSLPFAIAKDLMAYLWQYEFHPFEIIYLSLRIEATYVQNA